ncbi:MAG: copper amine oxidase N-terminal domain-containing protein [Syntrophomonadaceae bacterium]|jgi:hypothetical protein|nr:copper amine oxidase N-terminal domain-containing protein [Syntrophomonadaceae bacterium]
MKRKVLAPLIAAIMVLGIASPSFAAAGTRDISVNYSNIKLYIDLEPVVLEGANGSVVEPFISDGTTYLPLRAVSEALGLEVAWEGETKSVRISEVNAEAEETAGADTVSDNFEPFIGTKTLSVTYDDITVYVNNEEIALKDASGNAVEPFISDGTTYLPLRAVAEALGLTVSWDGATRSVYVGGQPEPAAADNTAYARYAEATEEFAASGFSYAAEINGNAAITVDDETMDMKISGSIKQVNHSATDIELAADVAVNVLGQDETFKIYYKDGLMYMDAAGEKMKIAAGIDEALAAAQVSNMEIEKDAIKEQSIEGNTLKFTLDGNKLMAAVDTLLNNGLGSLALSGGGYEIGDIVCTVNLDDKGTLKNVQMVFLMNLAIEDTAVSVSYDLTVAYTRIGDVSITAPADLSSYKELEAQ